jgi:hypothetical protein
VIVIVIVTESEIVSVMESEIEIEKGRKIGPATAILNAAIALVQTWTTTGTASVRGSAAGAGSVPENHARAK